MKKNITNIWRFITYDIWRITENEVTKTTFSIYTIIKTTLLCVNHFTTNRIGNKASALTYSTLLAIVPMMAILFAIARGFGFDNLMELQFRHGMGSNRETSGAIINFANSYLEHTKSSVFIGIGLILLLWTVLNLVSNIEITFNQIWQIKKSRSFYRKITDYFSMFLLLPVLIVLSGGLSIFMSTVLNKTGSFVLMAPIIKFLIRMIPFVLTWMMFTGLYIFMPNTKVKFKNALISGVIAGTAYQFFQYLYINGQIWVSNYNAIYGSFAALPLLLLWLQLSWTICLFGVELTYAGQNIRYFSFDKDTKNISRRYRDFIFLVVMSAIAKRFTQIDKKPYTASMISAEFQIPIRLTNQILYELQDINLIHEVVSDEKSEDIIYQPSMDVNKLNVAVLFDKLDTNGSENFKIDKEIKLNDEWTMLNKLRQDYYDKASKVLLKDLS
ncbi:MAG: YihY/virulence factor BrkB family protein [Bacteroidaceae bacterium]